MSKILRRKTFTSLLLATLFFQVFSVNSFAMSSQELPKNFKALSFEERVAWVTENVEGEYVPGKVEHISTGKNVDGRAAIKTYYGAYRSSGIKEAGVVIYKFDVRYGWSAEIANPVATVKIESIDVYDDCLYYDNYGNLISNSPIVRIDGPYTTHSTNHTIGICQSEVHTGLLRYTGYYDLYQYATLYHDGRTYLREVGGVTL